MAHCSRCGGEIEFRYVNGFCTPLHLNGSCTGGRTGASDVTDFTGTRRSTESCCYATHCPACGDEVFFIRHNGGSVWIDPPLGPPWYKHGCMDNGPAAGRSVRSELASASFLGSGAPSGYVLGVVTESDVSRHKRFTLLKFETDRAGIHILLVKFNAGFLTGKLAMYHRGLGTITWFEQKDYAFRVLAALSPEEITGKQRLRMPCPLCGVEINKHNLVRHVTGQHWYDYD